MGNIRVLDEHVANLIAAGEVVERPASVVKELVENAIDAGADTIQVQIEEGGLSLIRVTDNGRGIAHDDVPLAFQRHATSKVAESRDLFHIRTLGFRGEALPSIASVARVELVSAVDRSGLGTLCVVEGGHVKKLEHARTTRGTDIQVRDLFYNTPARLKYLKTVQTEFSHISDYVTRIALAHPDISIILTHNDKPVLRTPGTGELQQTIAAIYGTATARAMLEIRAEDADFTMTGWIAKPELTRANRYAMTTIVNGRYVRSYALQQAIIQAYHTLLPINRYPLAVLQLVMDPSLVDVNVHPAKLEVRFSKERELTTFVTDALRKQLRDTDLIPRMQAPRERKPVIHEQLSFYGPSETRGDQAPSAAQRSLASAAADSDDRKLADQLHRPGARVEQSAASSSATGGPIAKERSISHDADYRSSRAASHEQPIAGAPVNDAPQGNFRAEKPMNGKRQPQSSADRQRSQGGGGRKHTPKADIAAAEWQSFMQIAAPQDDADPHATAAGRLPALHVIGQHHGSYIVAEDENSLYLIDQHAAHERINYERFYKQFGEPVQASQELLVPITMEFTAAEAELLSERSTLFSQIGVYFEPFGGHTFIVRSVPEWMPKGEEADLLQEMVDWVLQEKTLDIAKLREKSAIMTACKASLKANDHLSRQEIDSLLDQLRQCANPFTCPHGRPIIISFSSYELQKMFKRVM